MVVPDKKRIQGELAEAYEALSDAEANVSEGRLKTATSRAYYAIFHAARAVLWSKGLGPKTHKGVAQLFGREVVKTKHVSEEIGEILAEARDRRELADYNAMTGSFFPEEVKELVRNARRFVGTIENILPR